MYQILKVFTVSLVLCFFISCSKNEEKKNNESGNSNEPVKEVIVEEKKTTLLTPAILLDQAQKTGLNVAQSDLKQNTELESDALFLKNYYEVNPIFSEEDFSSLSLIILNINEYYRDIKNNLEMSEEIINSISNYNLNTDVDFLELIAPFISDVFHDKLMSQAISASVINVNQNKFYVSLSELERLYFSKMLSDQFGVLKSKQELFSEKDLRELSLLIASFNLNQHRLGLSEKVFLLKSQNVNSVKGLDGVENTVVIDELIRFDILSEIQNRVF